MFVAALCGCNKQQPSSETTPTPREASKVEAPRETSRLTRETPAPGPEPTKAVIENQPVVQATPTMKAGLLMSQALQGQAQAKHDLMALAGDEKVDKAERDIAIRYLGNNGSPESLAIVAKGLLSSDPQIRTTAYYSLPENLRPPGHDYTAEPDAAAREAVAKAVEGLKK